jgi:glycine cleavage system aminomethyltransferase T
MTHPHIGTMSASDDVRAGREHVIQHGVVCISSQVGVVRMSAPESLDLLQRISTNSVIDIPLDAARSTVLTTEKGRIVDRIVVVHLR